MRCAIVDIIFGFYLFIFLCSFLGIAFAKLFCYVCIFVLIVESFIAGVDSNKYYVHHTSGCFIYGSATAPTLNGLTHPVATQIAIEILLPARVWAVVVLVVCASVFSFVGKACTRQPDI